MAYFLIASAIPENSQVVEQFPAEVSAQTTLKSVRVTGVDGHTEYGYHATVKIGGHVFKGVLCHAGPDPDLVNLSSQTHDHSHLGLMHLNMVGAVPGNGMDNGMNNGMNNGLNSGMNGSLPPNLGPNLVSVIQTNGMPHLLDPSLFASQAGAIIGGEKQHQGHDLYGNIGTVGM